MSRQYHSLLLNSGTADAPQWGVEFGDYVKRVVQEERDEYRRDHPAKALRIITTGDKQADIAAAVASLNDWRNATA